MPKGLLLTMSFEFIFLFLAGFFGGVLNSIAGGGSFITFPALIFIGIPPIMANATNTFASCAGYLSGTYAFRKELAEHKSELPKIIIISLLGGISGAWLLLQTSEVVFRSAIPWLLLFATVLFIFGGQINKALKKADKAVELITLKGEDHWLSSSETRLALLKEVDQFLQKHNPAGVL